MSFGARYVHTNLVARDWQRLAEFYEKLFGCIPVPPPRDLRGAWVDSLTNLPGAHIRGTHLRLPGRGNDGPTLEIFQYDAPATSELPAVNRPGLAHLAFVVDDIEVAYKDVLAAGGDRLGDLVVADISGVGTRKLAYVRDPEGNIIELQQPVH